MKLIKLEDNAYINADYIVSITTCQDDKAKHKTDICMSNGLQIKTKLTIAKIRELCK